MFLVNLMVTVALVRSFVGLLHSDGAEKFNETIKLAILFQNSIKKLQKLQNYVHSVIFRYITDFVYDFIAARNSSPVQSLITEGTTKHSLTAGNLLQELTQQLEYTRTKQKQIGAHIMTMVKKFFMCISNPWYACIIYDYIQGHDLLVLLNAGSGYNTLDEID